MTLPETAWHPLARLVGTTMSALPRANRYRAAVRLARTTAALLGPALMRRPHRYACSTLLDETIRALLRTMARRQIAFDPAVNAEVPAELVPTIRERGAIIVSAHFPLNALATRFLHDRGVPTVAARASVAGDRYIWGTDHPLEYVVPKRTVLVQIRDLLVQRRAVLMSIDRGAPVGRTVPLELPAGTLHISTAAFDFAKRLDVPMFFACVRSNEDREPTVYARRIEPHPEAFVECLREHVWSGGGNLALRSS